MTTTPSRLKIFYVFNTAFGKTDETENERVFFSYPRDCFKQDDIMKYVGLAVALGAYTGSFTSAPCEAMHTLKTRQVFLNPEGSFWLSLIVTLPVTERVGKDGKSEVQYHEEDVQDVVLQAALLQAYEMYKLFNGTLSSTVESYGRQAVVDKLDLYFPQYLQCIDFSKFDILDSFSGIQFLPLDKMAYLKIQHFVNLTESGFPQIKHTVFLRNDHLVWSGLAQDDMKTLYRTLTGGFLGASAHGSTLLSSFAASGDSTSSMAQRLLGSKVGFVTGPEDLTDDESSITAPRLFLSETSNPDQMMLHLILYQCHGVQVCFLIDDSCLNDISFYRQLDDFVGPHLLSLDSLTAEQQVKRLATISAPEVPYKYLYFNHMNLAQKSSFISLPKKIGSANPCTVSPEQLRFIADIHGDFAKTSSDLEVIMKTQSDYWVVGRKSDQREFFVILNQKNANLIEINEEIRKLSAIYFNSIFFID